MNMKLKPIGIFTALVAMASLTLIMPVFAELDGQGAEMQHKRIMTQDVMKELNLSPEQKGQITKEQNMNKEKFGELKDKMRAKRLELKQELEKPEIGKNKIDAIVADIKTLTGEQLELRVSSILAMKQILTPDQFQKLQKIEHDKYKKHDTREKQGRK